jgi:hypothetical protein
MCIQCLSYATYFSQTGISSGNQFLRSLLHCALGPIVLLRHMVVVTNNFDILA